MDRIRKRTSRLLSRSPRAIALLRAFPQSHRNASSTTVYTDHAPSTYVGSLSNKGRLSTWRINETSDLTGIVQTLYKAGQYLGPGPYGRLADPLSRMPRGEQLHRLELPALLTELLQRLPDSIRNAHSIRVTAEKDTHLATRIVQRWRVPKNPISNVRSDNKEDFDFLIAAPFAEKVTHKVAQLIRERKKLPKQSKVYPRWSHTRSHTRRS
jgi:hypothetical protein